MKYVVIHKGLVLIKRDVCGNQYVAFGDLGSSRVQRHYSALVLIECGVGFLFVIEGQL